MNHTRRRVFNREDVREALSRECVLCRRPRVAMMTSFLGRRRFAGTWRAFGHQLPWISEPPFQARIQRVWFIFSSAHTLGARIPYLRSHDHNTAVS